MPSALTSSSAAHAHGSAPALTHVSPADDSPAVSSTTRTRSFPAARAHAPTLTLSHVSPTHRHNAGVPPDGRAHRRAAAPGKNRTTP
ncbi:hypothetical protein V1L54_11490 [Streptomyces sp. TRM 70361]|uniref:hypothetical protein n=1 Tax=Streptomyces sp. TRM 70361 TaxID=3116553 RepID=UPI002E7B5650|nr:hypothetical protein [Streptomyces sp. TRM 70361]MEE1940012.1 hypothetical protein [Streptomyces sp. TRM 70361]